MFDGNKRYLLISNYRKEYLCNHYMCKDETFTRCVSISHKLYPKISARSVWRKKSRFFNLSHNATECLHKYDFIPFGQVQELSGETI